MKSTTVWVVSAFVVGSIMGGVTSSDTRAEFIEVPKTKVIHEPAPEPEKVPYIPEGCLDAVETAERLAISAEGIYASGEEQIAIVQDGRLYLAAQRNMSDIEERQRALHGETVGFLYELAKDLAVYEEEIKECKASE
jgi:hypothetical protein